MSYRHRPVSARQKPSAAWLNAVSEEVEALSALVRGARGGPGLSLATGSGGLLIGLMASMKERFIVAKITAAPPAGVPIAPSLCLYSAVGLDRKISVGPVAPDYGRSVANDEAWVYPDLVGNLCFIVRNPQGTGQRLAQLWVFSEIVCRGPC